MQRSLLYWIAARWKANTPHLAIDENPAMGMRRALRKLARRWESRFDEEAPKLADYLARQALRHATRAMETTLASGNIPVVQFKMSSGVRDAVNAITGENVALIKSIAQQHLTAVETAVLRSVAVGRDLETLAKTIEHQGGVTKRRAALIARDQTAKANAVITRVRQAEAGITHAIWRHSHGGKTPRPEHVAFDGQTYEIAKGAYLEGVWTWPGVEINCRCYSRPILPII